MKHFLIFFVLVMLFGCNESDEPLSIKNQYALLEIVSGNNQSGITGQLLEDSLILKVTPKNTTLKVDHFYVKAKMAKGNGDIIGSGYSNNFVSNANGKIKLQWRLGCDQKDQLLTFYLYNFDSCSFNVNPPLACTPIDSVTFSATSSTPSGWNRSCGISWVDRYNTKFRTQNNQLYAVNSGTLYKYIEGAETRWWDKIPGVPVTDIFDFGFTSTGSVYLLTENHGVYYSSDFKIWTLQTNGILDPRYPLSILVEDSVVYVSFMFDGVYRMRTSAPNFWKKLLIDGKYNEEYKFLTRHPNGELYLIDKWGTYWVSENSGDSWDRVPLEYKYANYETEDLKIHPSGTIYIGSGDASLAILNPDTYTGELISYYQWNASYQIIDNIFFRDDGVYYLVSFTPNPGIYSSANGWQKVDIGFNESISTFAFDSRGEFIVAKYDGIYYKKD